MCTWEPGTLVLLEINSVRGVHVSWAESGVWARHYPGLYSLHQMGAFYLLEMTFFSTGWRKALLTSWGFVAACNTRTQTPGTALGCANVLQMFCSHCQRPAQEEQHWSQGSSLTQSSDFALSHESSAHTLAPSRIGSADALPMPILPG